MLIHSQASHKHNRPAGPRDDLAEAYEVCVATFTQPCSCSRAERCKADFQNAQKERPVRGDNRTGQAIWALGVDGRSRRIQPMGRDYRSHIIWSRQPAERSKRRSIFLTSCSGDCAEILRGRLFRGVCGRFRRSHRWRRSSVRGPGALSATDRRGVFVSRACRTGQPQPPARRRPHRGKRVGLTGAEQIVTAGGAEVARGLRQRPATSSGLSVGLRSSSSAARPLT